jgi:KaiC/GvpD/RAD55 family RecA-like ATPase
MENEKVNKLISGAKFDDSRIITEINPTIKIRGKTVATEQNLICISGLPKSRKTVFSWAFVTSFFSGAACLDIEVIRKDERPFLLIDTESGDFSFSRNLLTLKNRLNIQNIPDALNMYLTRELSHAENIELIKQTIEIHKPSFILIDNLTDLVLNPNDPAESQKLIKDLKKITSLYNCTLITIIHLSKSNNFTVGWLGSTIDRAAQSVLKVTKDDENGTSTLEAKLIRDDAEFKPITIDFDKYAGDYAINYDIQPEEKEKKRDVLKLTEQEYINMINILFTHAPYYNYNELVESLKQLTGTGVNKVKTLISYLLSKGLLIQNKERQYLKNNLI